MEYTSIKKINYTYNTTYILLLYFNICKHYTCDI